MIEKYFRISLKLMIIFSIISFISAFVSFIIIALAFFVASLRSDKLASQILFSIIGIIIAVITIIILYFQLKWRGQQYEYGEYLISKVVEGNIGLTNDDHFKNAIKEIKANFSDKNSLSFKHTIDLYDQKNISCSELTIKLTGIDNREEVGSIKTK